MAVDEKADEARPDQASAPAIPPHRPFWPVALLLLGLIAAVLGAAFLLDRAYRPRVGVVAAPTSLAVAQPTSVPTTTAPATAPVVVPTATPAAAPTMVPTPTVAPTATTAPIRTTSPSGTVASTPGAAVKAGIEAPRATATAQPDLEQLPPLDREIAEAYLRHWNVLARAHYRLDTSQLPEVMTGAALARMEDRIGKLQAAGHAVQLDVELHFRITKATSDEAVIDDEYVNHSLYLDAVTKQQIPTQEPPEVITVSFQMKKVDGAWKVVDVVPHD